MYVSYSYVCGYVCMCTCGYVSVCVYVYVCIVYVCGYVCVCVWVCMHMYEWVVCIGFDSIYNVMRM